MRLIIATAGPASLFVWLLLLGWKRDVIDDVIRTKLNYYRKQIVRETRNYQNSAIADSITSREIFLNKLRDFLNNIPLFINSICPLISVSLIFL